jgi:CRISPR-associated protein Csx17
LFGARGAEAGLADITAFLAGQIDDARVLALARPLMSVAWWQSTSDRREAQARNEIDAAYAVVRLSHLSEPLDRGEKLTIPLDPEPIARLAAGNLSGAIAICLRRLRASGLSPVVRVVAGDARYARRLAASLAFPIRAVDVERCAELVTKPYELEGSVDAD